MFRSDSSENLPKTSGFLIFSRGLKGSIAKERVKICLKKCKNVNWVIYDLVVHIYWLNLQSSINSFLATQNFIILSLRHNF